MVDLTCFNCAVIGYCETHQVSITCSIEYVSQQYGPLVDLLYEWLAQILIHARSNIHYHCPIGELACFDFAAIVYNKTHQVSIMSQKHNSLVDLLYKQKQRPAQTGKLTCSNCTVIAYNETYQVSITCSTELRLSVEWFLIQSLIRIETKVS